MKLQMLPPMHGEISLAADLSAPSVTSSAGGLNLRIEDGALAIELRCATPEAKDDLIQGLLRMAAITGGVL